MVRSKSVGYFSETKVGSDSSIGANRCLLARRKPAGVAVKMPAVRLSKSRSMGVLHSPRLIKCKSRAFVFDFGGNNQTKLDISKLVISLDDKSENKSLKKPLFSM
jgi:hypothetical protein